MALFYITHINFISDNCARKSLTMPDRTDKLLIHKDGQLQNIQSYLQMRYSEQLTGPSSKFRNIIMYINQ